MNTAQPIIQKFRSYLFFVHESTTYILSVDELQDIKWLKVGQIIASLASCVAYSVVQTP